MIMIMILPSGPGIGWWGNLPWGTPDGARWVYVYIRTMLIYSTTGVYTPKLHETGPSLPSPEPKTDRHDVKTRTHEHPQPTAVSCHVANTPILLELELV